MTNETADDPPGSVPTPGDLAATYSATLVDEWVAQGMTDVVISPGSRSTPLAVAFAGDPRLRHHVVHDERAAAYLALGLGRASGRAAAVLCTSGTAAVHFHAAVVEADLAAVPLLVLTADRPPELRGRLAPQTIDQRDLYGGATRWYCEPGPPAAGSAPWWRDLARDAIRRTVGLLPGPVHLDLAFREPLVGTASALPPRDPGGTHEPAAGPTGAAWGLLDEEVGRLATALGGRRGVLVCGERSAGDDLESATLWRLADHLGWPVLADPLSGVRRRRPGLVSSFDSLLRHEAFAADVRPEVVLRIGGLLASRVTNEWLRTSGAMQVGVDRFGRCPDPDGVVSATFTARPSLLAEALLEVLASGAVTACEPAWRERWCSAEERACAALESALLGHGEASEPAVAMDLMRGVPGGSTVVVSSSMPVRDVEWYAPPRGDVRVIANRGANGIDGVTATAIGVALGTAGPTYLLTGDLAFLHDSSALVALRRRPVQLVIVVLDNDGGGIFHFLPQAGALGGGVFEELFATPHGTDLAALAGAHGLPVERVGSRAGFQAALAGASARGGARVVVVEGDRRRNVAVHGRLHAAVARALDQGGVAPRGVR
jgi:2-succinyl-5-enolpyruvyl-6-hydroxy-3-cyclohexene-1-carboxylate synthase